MKLVFTVEEVAAALQKSVAEFIALRPLLEDQGFPIPVRGLEDRWSIMDVITWVNRADPLSQDREPTVIYPIDRSRLS
jgi:hypothetical protein